MYSDPSSSSHPQAPVPGPTSLPVISAGPLLTAPDGQPGDVFVSTVFVGNISDRASDGLVRQLLMVSGLDPYDPWSERDCIGGGEFQWERCMYVVGRETKMGLNDY